MQFIQFISLITDKLQANHVQTRIIKKEEEEKTYKETKTNKQTTHTSHTKRTPQMLVLVNGVGIMQVNKSTKFETILYIVPQAPKCDAIFQNEITFNLRGRCAKKEAICRGWVIVHVVRRQQR